MKLDIIYSPHILPFPSSSPLKPFYIYVLLELLVTGTQMGPVIPEIAA